MRPIPDPIAAIDVGSNTIHLVVARAAVEGHDLETLADETELVRLGADLAATGHIGAERLARALAVVAVQRSRAEALGARTILGMATEGVRAAANSADVLARMDTETGVTLHLVSGEQEAALTFWGATSGARDPDLPRGVVDLGGGSMEVVVGQATHILWRVSLPVGSGALHVAYVTSDPPTAADLDRVRRSATDALRAVAPPPAVTEIIACGGSATSLALLATRALDVSSTTAAGGLPGAVGVLARDTLEALVALLSALPSAEITARYGVALARAPLLAPGALALLAALDRLRADEMLVSRRGIREGAIVAYLRQGDGWLAAAAAGSLAQR